MPKRDTRKVDALQSERCVEKLQALAEPTRLRIIDVLRHGPITVSEIAEILGLPIVTISHHLGILKKAELVQKNSKGTFREYRLHDGVLAPTRQSNGSQILDLGCCQLQMPPPGVQRRSRPDLP